MPHSEQGPAVDTPSRAPLEPGIIVLLRSQQVMYRSDRLTVKGPTEPERGDERGHEDHQDHG